MNLFRLAAVGAVLATGVLAGCAMHRPPSIHGAAAAPPAPERPWQAPSGAVPPEPMNAPRAAAAALPADLAARADSLTLGDIVDVALRNNPQTQASWAQARVGAYDYGSARGAYFPTINGSGTFQRSQSTAAGAGQAGGIVTGVGARSTGTASVNLSYLLFDFGGRSGSIAAARNAAVALDLTHNATLQNVALGAQAAYFTYQAQTGLVAAARLALAEADTNLAAAERRHQVGVATIADVLQAQTVRSQAELDLETAEGNARIARGQLAVSMGLPADAAFGLVPMPDTVPVAEVSANVDTLIARALQLRPDLAAARTQVAQAQAEVRVARSAELPALTLGSSAARTLYSTRGTLGNNYSLNLGLQVPIFSGFSRQYDLAAAQAQVDVVAARTQLLRTQVAQQVFTSYYTLQTATQRVRTSNVLLANATRSEEVARARYRAGVGTVVDLLTAQAALANARAQQTLSRWQWAISLSQLAHDVGVLGLRGEIPLPLADTTGGTRK